MAEAPEDPASADAAFATELASLRRSYAEALPAKVEHLAAALAEQRGATAVPTGTARTLAHRLAGTAGSFGCGGVGDVARRIEHALERLPSTGDATAAWVEIEALLTEARAEARRAAASSRDGTSTP